LSELSENLNLIKQNLKKYESNANIIAVCKKQPLEKVQEILSLGVKHLGINYINEFVDFKLGLQEASVYWHYIGSIQSNKLNKIVGHFEYIQSVSKLSTVEKIDRIASNLNIKQKIFFQLNLSGETTKDGFSVAEYQAVISKMSNYENIILCGLMIMPPLNAGRKYFEQLQAMQKEFNDGKQSCANCDIKYLSMGTSGDYIDAIQYGATHIRLGTVLMGQRG